METGLGLSQPVWWDWSIKGYCLSWSLIKLLCPLLDPTFAQVISPYPLVFNAPSSFFPVSWQICECVCMRESKRDVACSQLVSKVVWLVLGTPHIPGMPELYGGVTLLSPIHTKPQQWALLSESTSSSTSCPVSYQAEKLNDSNRKNSLADFLYR